MDTFVHGLRMVFREGGGGTNPISQPKFSPFPSLFLAKISSPIPIVLFAIPSPSDSNPFSQSKKAHSSFQFTSLGPLVNFWNGYWLYDSKLRAPCDLALVSNQKKIPLVGLTLWVVAYGWFNCTSSVDRLVNRDIAILDIKFVLLYQKTAKIDFIQKLSITQGCLL